MHGVDENHACLDLSAQQLVIDFGVKSLLLFKLMMLERRVLWVGLPGNLLTGSMLTTISLMPGLIRQGGDGNATNIEQYRAHDGELGPSILDPQGLTKRAFGFPLQIFADDCPLFPYLTLGQVESFMNERGSPSFASAHSSPMPGEGDIRLKVLDSKKSGDNPDIKGFMLGSSAAFLAHHLPQHVDVLVDVGTKKVCFDGLFLSF